jgi:hypothetical protein
MADDIYISPDLKEIDEALEVMLKHWPDCTRDDAMKWVEMQKKNEMEEERRILNFFDLLYAFHNSSNVDARLMMELAAAARFDQMQFARVVLAQRPNRKAH